MSLNLILGASGYGKTEEIYGKVVSEAPKNLNKNYIIVVPEQDSMSVTREITHRMPGRGIINVDVLSFGRFAHRIFDSAGRDTSVILDDTGKSLILRGIIRELSDRLTVFKANALKNGNISEIKSIISEFIQYDISPKDVDRMIEKAEGRGYLRTKLSDIRLIYAAFREKMEGRYLTREELLDAAIKRSKEAAFLDGAAVFFDGFTGFTPIQYRFIKMLMGRAADIYVTLYYDGSDGELFELSVTSAAALRKLAEECGIKAVTKKLYDNEKRRLSEAGELDHLEKNLFRKRPEEYQGDPGCVRICEAVSPGSEVRYVLREIKTLIVTGQCDYSDIGIIMSDTALYGRLLKEEAQRADLPVFIDETHGIRLNPFVEYVRAILGMLITDLSFDTVFHYLKTTMSSIEPEETDRLENYVRAAGIKGYSGYSRKFRYRMRDMTEEEAGALNDVRERFIKEISPVYGKLSRDKKMKCGDICNALQEFLEGEDTEEKLLRRAERFNEEGDRVRGDEYIQIYRKFTELLDIMRELIYDEEVDLREYLELVNAGLGEIRTGTVPPGRKCISAGDMRRSRLNGIKYLYFLGVNEGMVPKEGTAAGVLNDMDRQFLSETFTLAPTAYENIGTEKLYFYMAVSKPTHSLTITYASSGEDGSVQRSSFFADSVKKCLGISDITRVNAKDNDPNSMSEVRQLAACALRDGEEAAGEESLLALKFLKEEGFEDELKRIAELTARPSEGDKLGEALSKVLYGEGTALSPSRLEMFVSCAYEHFLRYALKLKEREEYGFEKREMGSLMHEVLNIISRLLKDKNKSFAELEEGESEELIEAATERFLTENENEALTETGRSRYFIERMKRIMRRTLKTLKMQQGSGTYKPDLFEQPFRIGNVTGRIDRVDISETAEAVYVSVIDYKSGNKSFDLNRVYYGLDIQLFLYLYGAMELEGRKHKDKTIKPGGIFYYHIDDPVVGEEDIGTAEDEAVEKAVNGKLKLRGVLNAEPEAVKMFDSALAPKVSSVVVPAAMLTGGQFSQYSSVLTEEELGKFTARIREICDDSEKRIFSGEIDRNPYMYDGVSPCELCAYSDMCDEKYRYEKSRERKFNKIF